MDPRVEEERIAMNVPCTSCGELLHDHDLECRHCGTLAPPLPGSSVFAEDPAPASDAEAAAAPPIDETEAHPWAIPIREPGVLPRERSRVPSGLPRPVAIGLVVLAVLVGLVGFATGALTGADRGEVTEAASRDDVEVAGETVTSDPTTTRVLTTTTTTTSTTTSTTSTSTTSTSTTTAPPPVAPASVPTLSSGFRGGWVAQLTSVPTSAGSASLESAFAAVRPDAPGAVVTRSDEWPSLRPGYWVVVAPGPFGSEDQVEQYCSSLGRTSDGCLPRLLANRR